MTRKLASRITVHLRFEFVMFLFKKITVAVQFRHDQFTSHTKNALMKFRN